MLRAALSLLLATALVTAPLKLVFAQTSQQDAVQQTAPPDSSGHRLIGVPTVTDNTSWLWAPLAGKDAIADIFAEDGSLERKRHTFRTHPKKAGKKDWGGRTRTSNLTACRRQ